MGDSIMEWTNQDYQAAAEDATNYANQRSGRKPSRTPEAAAMAAGIITFLIAGLAATLLGAEGGRLAIVPLGMGGVAAGLAYLSTRASWDSWHRAYEDRMQELRSNASAKRGL